VSARKPVDHAAVFAGFGDQQRYTTGVIPGR
jgi:hypothetical protein